MFGNCFIPNKSKNILCWYSSINFDLILFNQFACLGFKKKKELELTDDVKGIQCNLSFCTRDVSKILNSSFISKMFALQFLFLKTDICCIVRDVVEQKQ